MRSFLTKAIVLQFVFPLALSAQMPVVTQTFIFTGSPQSFTVPNCVTQVTADIRGAQGGGTTTAPGGLGGRTQAIITATPGEVLGIWVGGAGIYSTSVASGGFNGGGGHNSEGLAGTGGGASDIRRGTGLYNRILVAGGGGGGTDTELENRPGGAGGGLSGGAGGDWSSYYLSGGQGGTQSAGGAAGTACCYTNSAGGFGTGGTGGGDLAAGCGGGGGWYGGGGGLFGGGGGGSGYAASAGLTSTVMTSGYQAGNGIIMLSYTVYPIAISGPSAICSGASATLSASGASSYTWDTGSTLSSIVVSPSTTTTYSVAGTTSIGCPAIGGTSLSVDLHQPTLTISSSTNEICLGGTVQLTASGAPSYSWNNGVVNGVPFQPTVSGNYFVNAHNACGSGSASVFIAVNPVPVYIVSTPSVICSGNASTLSAISAGSTFSWFPFSSIPTASAVSVSPSATTIYTVRANRGYCYGTATVALSVLPLPNLTVTASSRDICSGNTVTMMVSGAKTYSWAPCLSSGSQVVVSPGSSTNYTVIGTSTTGCSSMSIIPVFVTPSATVSATTTHTLVCANHSVTLVASGANSYVWNTGNTATAIVVTPVISTDYTVQGFPSSGLCPGTASIHIEVISMPVPVPSQTDVCQNSTVTLVAHYGGTYAWSTGACTNTISVSPSSNTIYTVTATTNSNGVQCSMIGTIQVNVHANPTVTATSSRTTICRGEQVILTASGASSYTWDSGATGVTATVVPTSQSHFTVTGSDLYGCTDSYVVHLNVHTCTGVDEVGEMTGLSLYPNPSKEGFTVSSGALMNCTLYNAAGALITTFTLDEQNGYRFEIPGLAAGVYLVVGEAGAKRSVLKAVVN